MAPSKRYKVTENNFHKYILEIVARRGNLFDLLFWLQEDNTKVRLSLIQMELREALKAEHEAHRCVYVCACVCSNVCVRARSFSCICMCMI